MQARSCCIAHRCTAIPALESLLAKAVSHPFGRMVPMPVATVQHTPQHHIALVERRTPQRGAQAARLDAAVYHRRRTMAVIVAIAIVWVVLGAGSALVERVTGSPGLASAGADVENIDYIVQPGDTVWGIAAELAPEGTDVRLMVDAVRESVGGVHLSVGQLVSVPQSAS